VQDPVGEPSSQWTDIWKVAIQDQPSDPDPGTAQPKVNTDADTSIFTWKTKVFAVPRVDMVLAAICIGDDLSPMETIIVQELIKEYVDCFALSMGEVYHGLELNKVTAVPPMLQGNIHIKQQKLCRQRWRSVFNLAAGFYAV
jgi:hypothetical protein